MKTIRYTLSAAAELQRHHSIARRVLAKLDAYARTGAGNVKNLVGRGKRLRVGDFRIVFEETETEILVTKIGPRGKIYD